MASAFGITLLLGAKLAQSEDSGSREAVVAALEQQNRSNEIYYSCIFDADKEATRKFVGESDPYFFRDPNNVSALNFTKAVPRKVFFEDCAAKLAASFPDRKGRGVGLDLRHYRNWAGRRVYLEAFPSMPNFGELKSPRRQTTSYGAYKNSVSGLLSTIDCAVKREPSNADWLIRNGNLNEIQTGTEYNLRITRFVKYFNGCKNKFTPIDGNQELLNNSAALMADSLMRMSIKSANGGNGNA